MLELTNIKYQTGVAQCFDTLCYHQQLTDGRRAMDGRSCTKRRLAPMSLFFVAADAYRCGHTV